MSKTLRQVNVFIASPGDVSDDRYHVRKVVERINRLVARPQRFLLEPIGWEDIPAGKANRTQEIMNPYVDGADIFIGILNKRFGSPTGVAESGTEEEYNRIEKRWHNEDPKPEIMIFFKKISEDNLANPGEQLQHVLEFKKRISNTVLYKEFEGSNDLGEQIENALATWIYNHKESSALMLRQADVDSLGSTDFEILSCLIQHPDASIKYLHTFTNYSISNINSSVARLERHGLATRHFETIRASNSTEGFLSIVKHLIVGDQWRLLLQSDYYSHMLKDTINDLIAIRFHYKVQDELADFLQKIALLSPKAASYILFGDTSLYDNLAEQARTLGDQQIAIANEMTMRNILQNVLMSYAEDSINAKLMDTLDGRFIAGQIITMRVAGAYEDGLAFEAHSVMPLMRVRASTNLNKGQMVSGSPGLFVQMGTILMHLNEFDLAEKEFDIVLNPEMPSDVRAAAMNNKGLIFLKRGQVSKAVDLFRQSSKLNPTLSEPRKNLEVAESMLDEKK